MKLTRPEFPQFVKPGMAIILRGAPGSGKSSLLEGIREAGDVKNVLVSSADSFRMVDGVYVFDKAKNGEAHGACLRDFIYNAGVLGVKETDIIVSDNTNINVQDIAPYISIAGAFGWQAVIVNLEADPEIAAARNLHGVPPAHVARMHDRMNRFKLPTAWRQVSVGQEA